MLAFAGFTLSWAPLLPPVAVQVRLSSAKLAGGPPSVTLQLPAGTLTQSSVLVELSTPALSFNVKADGVVSDVQLGVVEAPTGSGMFDVKLKFWLTPRGSVCLMILISPQLLMFTGIGAMKSFSVEVNDWPDERLFRSAAPKCWHTFCEKTPAPVRLMRASPNVDDIDPFFDVLPLSVLGFPGGLLSVTSALFTEPSAKPPVVRLTSAPQQGTPSAGTSHWVAAPLMTHLDRLSVGTPLPPKSKVTSMSPAVRSLVTPFALAVLLWLNSKSRCAEPCVFVRSKARYR